MKSQALKDLGIQILDLSFRDMMTFSDGLGLSSYQSGQTRAEQILKWAESITAPPPQQSDANLEPTS